MKTLIGYVLVVLLAVITPASVMGQGHGHGKHDNPGHKKKHTTYYRPVNHHHQWRSAHWVPVRHHREPRYVYFRDYNVYYDCRREVYLWVSGGRWMITADLPIMLAHVNLVTATVVGVDYWDDDITYYVARSGPGFFSIRAEW